jgi:hypothetical protein
MTDLTTIDPRVAPDIPKINRTERRDTIIAVARELARFDGYIFTFVAFDWLRFPPHGRNAADINPRSIAYARRAIVAYGIIKGRCDD